MTRQELFDWCRQQYGTEPDYPWNDWNAVLRHTDNNKWYGVVLEVNRRKLGLADEGIVDILNVKCDPVMIGSLRMQSGFLPGVSHEQRQMDQHNAGQARNGRNNKRLTYPEL